MNPEEIQDLAVNRVANGPLRTRARPEDTSECPALKHGGRLISQRNPPCDSNPPCDPARCTADRSELTIACFCTKWGLNGTVAAELASFPPHTRASIMQLFRPKPLTRDRNRLFHGFCKTFH